MTITIQTFFALAMKRSLEPLVGMQLGTILNLGAGNHAIPGTIPLDFEHGWDADKDPLPYGDGDVDGIHAYHFFEHVADPIAVLAECQRVLRRGGVLQIAVPHYLGAIAYQDLDHKHFFATETWQKLFDNPYYKKFETVWRFRVHFNVIMGINERNLCLLTQLVKE